MTQTEKHADANELKSTELDRSLTFTQLLFYGVGTILGLGIYVILGKVGGDAGRLAPFAFLVAAFLAAFTGLSYGELSARIPKSAGEVNYVYRAFEWNWLAQITGWLIVFSAIVSTATVVNGYVGYFRVYVELPGWLIITGIILILGGVAIKGISESVFTIMVITVIEVAGLLFVIFAGRDYLIEFPREWRSFLPQMVAEDWRIIFSGAFLAFFAFIGFEDLVNVSEESKNPAKDMPRAIIYSLAILTILYILVAIIGTMALSAAALGQSDAPLADILAQKNESYPKIISLISTVAIINGVLVQIVMSARVLYGMSQKKMVPAIFGRVNNYTRTPVWATIFSVSIIWLLALSFKLKELAEATNYILLFVFVLVNLSLWRIRVRGLLPPVPIRKIPIFVPIVGAIASSALLMYKIWESIFA